MEASTVLWELIVFPYFIEDWYYLTSQCRETVFTVGTHLVFHIVWDFNGKYKVAFMLGVQWSSHNMEILRPVS